MERIKWILWPLALVVSSLFLVQASAQNPPPVKMTGCVTKGGDTKNWNFGDEPLKPCSSNDEQVTFVLQAGLEQEAAARINADNALDTKIAANTSSIVSNSSLIDTNINKIDTNKNAITVNSNRIAGTENEIGDAPAYANSRIDQNQHAATGSNWHDGVIYTNAGAIESSRNFYRTINYNIISGEAVLTGEINHALDPWDISSTSGYWFCNIGDHLSHADLQYLFEHQPDDFSLISGSGFTQSSASYWTFKFKNTNGSPYARIQVWDDSHADKGKNGAQPNYVDVTAALASSPVTGWLYGKRGIHSSTGDTSTVYIGLSHPELKQALLNMANPVRVPTSISHVLVDINASVTNAKYKPNGDCRVVGC